MLQETEPDEHGGLALRAHDQTAISCPDLIPALFAARAFDTRRRHSDMSDDSILCARYPFVQLDSDEVCFDVRD